MSSDDESLLDEEVAQAVDKAVKEPWSLPMMCPVCSTCKKHYKMAKYSYKLFKDYNSVRQHASGKLLQFLVIW